MDWSDPPEASPLVVYAAHVVPKSAAERLREIEDNMLVKSLSVIDSVLSAPEIEFDPDSKEPVVPEGWVGEYGPDEAKLRTKIAGHGLLTKKDAPTYLTVAQQVSAGIIKARATEKAAPRELSLTVVQIPAMAAYPKREIER